MNDYKNILLFCTITLLLTTNVAAQSNTGKTDIDSVMSKRMFESGIVGLGAAIIIDKKVVWKKGYGFSDIQSGAAFTTSTLMNIASVSKTVTGACLMKAVEQGKLSLDEDINNYLSFKIHNPYFPEDKITLRNLSTHTSGLTDRYPFYTDSLYFNGKDSPQVLGDFLQNYFMPGGKYYSKENFLNHKSGTFREYSNIGAALAGYIVEVRTGQKLNEYSKRYLFGPLKMEDTGWFMSEINLKKHTKLYKKQDNNVREIPLYGCTTYPDGGVRSSVDNLSNFFICLLNDGKYKNRQVLKAESVMEMLRFQFDEANKPENVKPKSLNSGIFWATKMGATRIGHNGSDPGVRVFMLSDLNKQVGVILFINTSLSEKEENKFFEIYEDLYRYGIKLRG
ncbi:serine hydrolase [Pedobacter sp. KBS0701]|uniref:serine hydrolase domain-containing protein n=1 Tax=Pedobacter sp. KBS0701 TaxID=2578106 RepID=UPI001AEF817A|nr:serine hydrolase domain-containing protein [Pedobacter sp. KBS0701]